MQRDEFSRRVNDEIIYKRKVFRFRHVHVDFLALKSLIFERQAGSG